MIVGRRHTERHGKLHGSGDGGVVHRGGSAPCVVGFHGFTGTTWEIRPMLDAVAKRGFAVRAPLLPGHGSSAATLQDLTFDAIASEMAIEMEKARAEHGHFVLAGFSLGSLVAMELAARKPEGLVGLVVLGNAITLNGPTRAALSFVDRRGWKLPDWYLLKPWAADLRDVSQRERIVAYDRDPIRAALEVYRGGVRVRGLLDRIACPTLVLHGGRDLVCPKGNAKLVADALGAHVVKTRIFAESGHMICADHERDDVGREVADFVASVAPRVRVQSPVDP